MTRVLVIAFVLGALFAAAAWGYQNGASDTAHENYRRTQ